MTGNQKDSDLKQNVLVEEALRLYIADATQERDRNRSWLRQPNNLISVVAIVISLLSVLYGLRKDHYDGIDKDLQSLSATISDLTKLDSDILTATLVDKQRLENLQLVLNNRRVSLLTEADRLIGNLGARVPLSQLAVLGPAYDQVGEYDKAAKYFLLMTQSSGSPMMLSEAWRSLAITYELQGPDFNNKVSDAFDAAARVFPDPKDIGSINVAISIYEQWGQFEFRLPDFQMALQHFGKARQLADRLPCPEFRPQAVTRLISEIQQTLTSFRSVDQAKAMDAQDKMAPLMMGGTCGV